MCTDTYKIFNKYFTAGETDIAIFGKVWDSNGDSKVTLEDIENKCIQYLV